MRTLVEIPDRDVTGLKAIAERKKLSPDEVIREALSAYVAREKAVEEEPIEGTAAPVESDALKASFGLWGKDGEDGLAYQERLRSEW